MNILNKDESQIIDLYECNADDILMILSFAKNDLSNL